MSLIPYQSLEGREIVLRHRNAIVVRDPDSKRLEIRGYAECPTCHQPLRPSTSERPFERPYEANPESYVSPSYFRMLHVRNGNLPPNGPLTSPGGRRFHPALPDNGDGDGDRGGGGSEGEQGLGEGASAASAAAAAGHFVSETRASPHAEAGGRIKREAFTPNYFKTFFVEERVLGKGGKGVVLLVRHEIDGCHLGHFACKRVPIGDDHAWLEKVLIEVELLANLSHPNLVSYRHVWLEDTQLTLFGPPVPCAFILQQYCNGGDLHQYIVGSVPRDFTKEELKERMRRRRSRGNLDDARDGPGDNKNNNNNDNIINSSSSNINKPRLSFEEIYSLFKDVTSGVAYLHSANYVHRDLKPSNCLLHREGGGKLRCLISDFGEVQPEHIVRKSTGSTGTISYCAPEVLRMDAHGAYANFTTKSDVFSLGMILFFMCFGRLPYRSANALQEELEDIDLLRAEITDWKGFQDERRERPDLPAKLYMLLKKLLALDPAQRPSANEVLGAMRSETIGSGGGGGGSGSGSGSGSSSGDGGIARDRSMSPTKGLRSSRIQTLDSPAPPGTPAGSSEARRLHRNVRKRSTSNLVLQQQPQQQHHQQQNPQQQHQQQQQQHLTTAGWPEPPLLRRESVPDIAFSSPGSTALRPTRALVRSLSRERSLELAPASPRERRRANIAHASSPPPLPPLLLAAPPSSPSSGHHVARISTGTERALMQLRAAADMNREVLRHGVLLILFIAKIALMVRPCWPYMARLEISIPLTVLAALDLGPARRSRRPSSSSSSSSRRPSYHDGTITAALPGLHQSWLGKRALLLALHIFVVWMAGGWGVLCASRNDGPLREW